MSLQIPLRVANGTIREVPLAIDQFQRPVLKARVHVGDLSLMVFVAHLKSKSPIIKNGEDGDDPFMSAIGQARATILRAAEAAALRHLILQEMASTRTPVIVLADLNDTPDAASTQIVCGASGMAGLADLDARVIERHQRGFAAELCGRAIGIAAERDHVGSAPLLGLRDDQRRGRRAPDARGP